MLNKAIFWDRDRTLNTVPEGQEYVYKMQDLHLYPDVVPILYLAKSFGYINIIISNQSGIAKDLYSESQLYQFNMMLQVLTKNLIADGFYCKHQKSDNCSCRKPRPGLIFVAAHLHNIDLSNSICIGDQERDIEAGISAGIGTTILLDREGLNPKTKASSKIRDLTSLAHFLNK